MKGTDRFIKKVSTKIKLAQTILSFCVLYLLAPTSLFAQPTNGTSTFDGAFLQLAEFGGSPRTGSLDGWTFTSVGGGNGYTSRNGSGQISMSMQTPTYFSIGSDDGSEFQLDNINIEFYLGSTTYTITGYRDGSPVTGAVFSESNVHGEAKFIDISSDTDFDNIDEFRFTFSTSPSSSSITIEDITISAAALGNTAPIVTTSAASSITATGATFSGNVTDNGGDPVTERGFVYDTNSNPTTSDTKIQDGTGTGAFSEAISGLNPETTYYVRAYAINGEGTSYGSEQIFTTSAVSGEKFDFESATATYTGWNTKTLTVEDNDVNPSFTITATADKVFKGSENGWAYNGSEGLYFGWDALETQVDFEIETGNSFDLKGFYISHQGDGDPNNEYILSTDKGSITITPPIDEVGELTFIDVTGNVNAAYFQDIDSFSLQAPTGGEYFEIDDIILDDFQKTIDNNGDVTAAGDVTEPVGLPTTATSSAGAVDVFDFNISDGGGDGFPLNVTALDVNVSGTSTDAERDKVTWRLDGPDASNVIGSYDAGTDKITFSGLSISIPESGYETYTISAYYNDNTGLTEDRTFILSVDGDTDLTLVNDGSKTQMGATSAVTNGSGSTIDITATQLAFTTQPAGSVSGSALTTQPVVTAKDAAGNTDVDFTETITLTEASAGTLTNNTQAATSGVATFSGLTYTATADQQSFTLTANDQDGVGSNLPTVDANAVTSDVVATKLVFNTEPAPTSFQADGSSTSFTTVPVVEATDANDVVDTGYSTGFVLSEVNGTGSATLTGTGDVDGAPSTVTLVPASGAATFTNLAIDYSLNDPNTDENFNLQAASGGLTSANSTQLTAIADTAPTGYTVSWDDALINASEASSTTFTVSNAEVGATINYSISSSGDGNTSSVSGSESVTSSTQQVTADVSSLTDGTLTVEVSLTDDGNNTGDNETDNSATLDQTAPAGYSVSIDQNPINAANDEAVGFTFAGAEVGATYNYTFSSSGGGTNVTGSGTISTATDQITGIDVSGLGDGTITLSVVLTDDADNEGSAATDTKTKYTAVNSAPVVSNLDGDNVSLQPGESKGIDNGNDATVSDSDSPDFNGGYFQITDKGNNNTANGDFSLDGTKATSGGDGSIAVGETIAVGGTDIGSINASNDGQNGQTLRIVFSSGATPARIQTLIQNLRWGVASGSGLQTFTLYIQDGDGTKNSGDDDTEVDFAMTLGNPPMVSHLNGDEVDFIEGGSPVLLDAGTQVTLTDADNPANYNGGNLNATVSSGAAASEDKLTLNTGGSVSLSGITAGSNVSLNGDVIGTLANNIAEGNDLRINLNSEATLSRIQELLRAIQYANNASPVTKESREVMVTVTDNENLTSSASTITINTLSRPEAADSRVLVEKNAVYTFKPSDFGLSDAGYSIKIESLPANGTLKLDGNDVSAGDEIGISSIENHLLTWMDDSDEYGYGYTSFDFKLIDDGDLESADSYTLSVDVGIRNIQFTEGKGWRFLSSPSSDDDYANIFNGLNVDLPPATYPSLYELDQPTYTWDPVESLSTSTERGKGFIFYQKVGEGPAALSFEGNWTDLSDLFEYSGLNYDGTGESSNPDNFYLVGNPHPVALDFCEFSISHVSEAITLWDPETGAGDYVSKSCEIEKGIEIAPFQSFWIRTTEANPTASIPEEAYLGRTEDGYFKEKSSDDSNQPLITMNLNSEDHRFSNQLHILFSDNGEEGLDPMDAPKLSAAGLTSEWLSFYSMDSEGESYAIQAMSYPEAGMNESESLLQIPLHVETTEEGFFRMDWTLSELRNLDADLYLKDNVTGNTIDLNTQEEYSFMMKPTVDVEKAKDPETLQILHQPFAKLTETGQNTRFTLLVDYGAPDQNSVGIDLPEEFKLQQNYPNPFNPVTVIQFQLADQSDVQLSVYDLTGREVATLVNKPLQAGNHQVSFNAQNLSSGVYIYTLKAGAQMQSRKLTIVK